MKVFQVRISGVLGLLALVLGAGCARAPDEPVLEVGLANLRFTQLTVFETTAVLDIRLDNLSPEEIRVTGGSHRVTVNGISLGRGMTGDTITVPRLGSSIQTVEFHLRNLSVARTIHDLGRSRVVDYTLESTLHVGRPAGSDRTVRVRNAGRLDLQGVQGDPSLTP